MLTPLHPGVVAQVDHLREAFRVNLPFPHVVIDEFLTGEYCRRLVGEFPQFDPIHARNEFGETGGKAVVQNVPEISPAYKGFDRMLRSREFLSLIGNITGISHLVYDPDYAGAGTHENLEGQDLDPHIDFNYHPARPLHRRLNLILFLNPEWEETWGGSLELHQNPWLPAEENEVKTILPIKNRCVLFETSERSWHGFSRISLPEDKKHLSRRSIAVYFYTKERPAHETAPSHGTVYVQRPMPDHLKTGHILQEADIEQVRRLLARRDKQIQFLYQRELEFSSVIERILRSPSYRFGRLLSWPLRKLLRTGRTRSN